MSLEYDGYAVDVEAHSPKAGEEYILRIADGAALPVHLRNLSHDAAHRFVQIARLAFTRHVKVKRFLTMLRCPP